MERNRSNKKTPPITKLRRNPLSKKHNQQTSFPANSQAKQVNTKDLTKRSQRDANQQKIEAFMRLFATDIILSVIILVIFLLLNRFSARVIFCSTLFTFTLLSICTQELTDTILSYSIVHCVPSSFAQCEIEQVLIGFPLIDFGLFLIRNRLRSVYS